MQVQATPESGWPAKTIYMSHGLVWQIGAQGLFIEEPLTLVRRLAREPLERSIASGIPPKGGLRR